MVMDVRIGKDHEQEQAEAQDKIDGQELELEVMRKARALEMEWYRKMYVCETRPTEECFEKTKKPPSKVKWVDRNRGERQHMNVRPRLAAKHINKGKEQGLFAATPPLEVLRVFWHHQRDIKAFVHGDDFMSSGERTNLSGCARDR